MTNSKRPLSYSAYTDYVTCPKKYELKRIEKIVPTSTPSHLIFGSAVDKALNEVLLGKSDKAALDAAQEELKRLVGENVVIEDVDYDGELITDHTREVLMVKLTERGWTGTDPNLLMARLLEKRRFGEVLETADHHLLAVGVFFSFLEKIQLIIQGFRDYFLPQVESVVSVQREVKRGILDFEVKLKGVDGVLIGDNKTASRDYAEDAVRTSVQLAGYGATKALYVVFNKTVKKNRVKTCSVCEQDGTGKRHKTCDAVYDGERCNGEWLETISPEIIPQILIDDISEHTRELVESSYQAVEDAVEKKVFPRNLSACGKQFGKPCDYINLCWHGDMRGLCQKKDK